MTAVAQQRERVWRFVAYAERFGFERKGPVEVPQFIRWYINGWEGAGADVVRAVNALRAERDYIWLIGAVVELLTAVTATRPEDRGQLLSSRKRPATSAEIGSMLRVDGRKAHATLMRLDRVGLLEKVPWQSGGTAAPIPDEEVPHLLQNVASASKKTGKRGGKKPPKRAKNEDEALKKRRNDKTPTVNDVDGQGQSPPLAGQAEGQGQGGGNPPTTPTTTPPTPMTPTKADDGVGPGRDRCGGQPGRTDPTSLPAGTIKMADVLAQSRHRYSAGGNAFAIKVMDALRWCGTRDESCRERGHWSKPWDAAMAVLDGSAMARIEGKVLRVAAQVGADRAAHANPEGYVLKTFQNEIRDQKRKLHARGAS